jgi:hypothetical protein
MRETRRRMLLTMAGFAAGTLAARPAIASQRPQPLPSPNAPSNQNAPAGLDNAGVQQGKQSPAINPLAWSQIKTDVQKLFQMTSDFRDHVVQINLNSTLPLSLIKEAHQIEKLAKQIQDHMKS